MLYRIQLQGLSTLIKRDLEKKKKKKKKKKKTIKFNVCKHASPVHSWNPDGQREQRGKEKRNRPQISLSRFPEPEM